MINPAYEIKLRPMGFGREQYVISLQGHEIGWADTEFEAQVLAVKDELERQ